MTQIRWGIIGCGDVTEVKSGPAFNKVDNSALLAVMRRNAAKAEDYAIRHGVPKWYADADQIINDPEINAIYIATPPLNHKEYTIKALNAGKPVYVEKPMALTEAECLQMLAVSEQTGVKLTVAHYRRELPLFKKVKELIEEGAIGEVRFINLLMLQGAENSIITQTEDNWRVNPAVSGGGLFHDLAPHQLDMMLNYFGDVKKAYGYSANQARLNSARDIVSGEILFENDILFRGLWSFNVPAQENTDSCEIVGATGKISFSFFRSGRCSLHRNGETEHFDMEVPVHIQQPMIAKVVNYFSDKGPNPCSGKIGAEVLRIIDVFTKD